MSRKRRRKSRKQPKSSNAQVIHPAECPTEECHLLRVPREIRDEIYCYLLCCEPTCWLTPTPWFQWPKSDDPARRHPAILQGNRQLYAEASSILYSRTKLVSSIKELSILRSNATFMLYATSGYQHDTLSSPGGKRGTKRGKPARRARGLIRPDVFTRFEHITVFVDLHFDYNGADLVQISISNDFTIDADDMKNFESMLQENRRFEDLAAILGRSPILRSLELELRVHVRTHYRELPNVDEPGYDTEDEDELELAMKLGVYLNEAATDLLITIGILDALKMLGNVSKFELRVMNDPYADQEGYRKLEGRAKRAAQELKDAIEHHM